MSERFDGFPKGTLTFLAELARNNEKPWFDAHRKDYDDFYIAPSKAFVSALGPRLRAFAPKVHFEPKVNGSMMRINRDVRFSKDKSPYKSHLDLFFWEGADRNWENAGYYLRLTPASLMLGAGMYVFSKPMLDAYRAAVVDKKLGAELEQVLEKVQKAGDYELGGAERKKVPRGFDADHPRARLLLHDGLYVGHETKVPKEIATKGFVEYCAKHYQRMAPINSWLGKVAAKVTGASESRGRSS